MTSVNVIKMNTRIILAGNQIRVSYTMKLAFYTQVQKQTLVRNTQSSKCPDGRTLYSLIIATNTHIYLTVSQVVP